VNSIEEFLLYLEKKLPPKILKKEFISINTNEIPDLKKFEGFDIIYDERKEGRLAYKGLLNSYCIYNAEGKIS